jgi:hypothetical protein
LNCFHIVAGRRFSNKMRIVTQICSITTQFIKPAFMGLSGFSKTMRNIKQEFPGCFLIEWWLSFCCFVAGMLQRLAIWLQGGSKSSRRREQEMWLGFTFF